MTVLTGTGWTGRDAAPVFTALGVDPEKLGCIMADVTNLDVTGVVDPDMLGDLYYGEGYDQGPVGESTAHVTLLHGLVHSGVGLGSSWSGATVDRGVVDMVLDGAVLDSVTLDTVSVFDVGDAWCVVGLVKVTELLLDAHRRLGVLPHIDMFTDWVPHVTLAYVDKSADVDRWVNMLDARYAGKTLEVTGLNYGDDLP